MADDPQVEPLSTPTAHYGWAKPTVGGDNDAWGGELNATIDGIDSTVYSLSTSIPAASATTPAMDGTGAAGAVATFARGDHVHPTDTSRYAASNPSGYQTAAQVTAALPVAASSAPLMDGAAAVGASAAYARADHVHPTDTSLYPASNPSGFQTASQVSAALPQASSTTPAMDGTAAVGSETKWAHGDHVHPTDTSRYAASNPSGYQTAAQVAATVGAYVPLAGGTMSGLLTLSGDPSPANGLGAATKQYVDAAVASATSGFGNRLRNGAMDVWQRGVSGSVGSGSFAYYADGWKVSSTGAATAVAQVAAPWASPSTVFAMKLTGNTSLAAGVCQPIESYLAAPLAGKVCTFQARIQNNTGGSLTPQLRTWVPTSSDVFGTLYNSPTALTADLALTNLQPIASGATAVVAYTFAVSANAIRGYRVDLDFGSALNANTKNVVIGELDLCVTPGVATGLNSAPPAPELRHIAAELALCQRYYEFSGVINAPFTYSAAASFGAGWMTGNVYYKVDKRATPTVAFANINYVANCSALVAAAQSARGFDVSVTNNTVGGVAVSFSWTATAEL